MKHIQTFEGFLNERLNESKLADFHPFLDGTDIDPLTIMQFYVEPRDFYIKINSGDDAKDKRDLEAVRNNIKKIIKGSARVYLEPWYVDVQGMRGGAKTKKDANFKYQYYSLQFVYNSEAIAPEYHVGFAQKFDPTTMKNKR